jgi:hypothetical protein
VASLRVVAPSDAAAAPPAWAVPIRAGEAVRAAPLLAVDASGVLPMIVVGQAQITVPRGGRAAVVVVVHSLWQGDNHSPGTRGWRPVMNSDGLEQLVIDRIAAVDDGQARMTPGHEALATRLAYRIAHQARDAVAALRSLRYQLEPGLGETFVVSLCALVLFALSAGSFVPWSRFSRSCNFAGVRARAGSGADGQEAAMPSFTSAMPMSSISLRRSALPS